MPERRIKLALTIFEALSRTTLEGLFFLKKSDNLIFNLLSVRDKRNEEDFLAHAHT